MSQRIAIPPFSNPNPNSGPGSGSNLSLWPHPDSRVVAIRQAKARVSRDRARRRWVIQPLGSSRVYTTADSFRAACDQASFVTLMEMRMAGLRTAD